ncbi:hypothetical protein [uncultured Abyssibacter sp.]|uniref:hypothetical protein n=1 Tax=uncultured Abyssibacter sp. TaxID=2320202 RepID=UPI0032B1EB58
MSNKGEDVKQLFAHLGLDPSTYRDIKGEGDGPGPDAVKPKGASRPKARKMPESDGPVIDPEDYPPPPRVQHNNNAKEQAELDALRAASASSEPEPEAESEIEPEPEAEPVTEPEFVDDAGTEPEPVDETPEPVVAQTDEPEVDELALIEAMPDRWSLLASLGAQKFPVADIPDEPVELGEWSHAPEDSIDLEQDSPRLRRAGSLAALVRGTERVAQSARRMISEDDVRQEPVADVVDEDVRHAPPEPESPEPVEPELTQAATPEPTGQAEVIKEERSEAGGTTVNASSEAPADAVTQQEGGRPARPTSGAIAKLMGRLGQPPVQRRPEGAKLKLHYERREAPMVAENHLDQSLPSVFGRLEKSRVD